MAHSIEIPSIDKQTPLLLPTEKDEIEEGRKVDHLIEIKETNGQDPSGSLITKSSNQYFDKMLNDLDNFSIKSRTIFKVNVRLRESNPDAYTPKMVSIGPYHRENRRLRPMEKYKLLYLRRFLQRKEGLNNVESFTCELEKLKKEALNCYDDIEDLDNDSSTGHQNFLEMLLLDGCFVIEFIRDLYDEFPEREDKIISVGCIHNQILRDLLLLENQLPFFVLRKLLQMTDVATDDNLSFIDMLRIIFRAKMSAMSNPASSFHDLFVHSNNAEGKNIQHLLHILHMSFHRNPSTDAKNFRKSFHQRNLGCLAFQTNDEDYMMWRDHDKILPNATELSEAGVTLKKVGSINYFRSPISKKNTSFLFDIKFQNGVMKIPCFQVVDDTESLLRNLIAYEQHSDECPKYFSDFAVFMDFLIDSDKDVNLLRKKGIIVSWMEDDKEVATFFNRIGKGVFFSPDDFYYKEECRKAFEHCEKRWNKMKASLRHNYFSSLWKGASTAAAIVLLILTTIQTILAFTGSVK